jgi:hypothetical protein
MNRLPQPAASRRSLMSLGADVEIDAAAGTIRMLTPSVR